tara:strand:- start:2140 stop:2508 length:369 start_codon:yes stop_codon:yes gene_type:complete
MTSGDFVGSFSTSSGNFRDVTISALIRLKKEDRKSKWNGEITFQKSFGQKDVKDTMVTPVDPISEMVPLYAIQPRDGAFRFALGITNVNQITENLIWGNQVHTKTAVAKDDWAFGSKYSFNT